MRVSCFGLVGSTCQVTIARKTALRTPLCVKEIVSTKPRLKRMFVCTFVSLFVCVAMCFFPGPAQYVFRTLRFVVTVPLNTRI